MLRISQRVTIPDEEIEISAIRAGGPGGQHVDKAATAVHLRFDIGESSLPASYRQRLLSMRDHRITAEGIVVIKARSHRSREKNVEDALDRLRELVRSAGVTSKVRRPTRPSRRARERRTDEKKKRGRTKALRKGPID